MDHHDELLDLALEECVLNGAIDAGAAPAGGSLLSSLDSPAVRAGSESIEGFAAEIQPPKAATKPMRNPSRERLKRELAFLREYSKELEEKIQRLRFVKRPHREIQDEDLSTALKWRCQVDSERVKRIKSERENAWLQRSLQTQLRVAEELSTYLQRRAISAVTHEAPTHIPPMLVMSSLDLVVAQFQSDIDRAYAAIGSIFPGPSWESLPDERVFVTTVKTRKFNESDQMYIELLDTAHRDHPYERTADAAWEATRLVYAHESRVTELGPCTDTMLASRYRSTGQTRTGAAKDLVTLFAAKKFVEADRTIIVWRTCNSPAQHDTETPMQALSDETGWMVVTKVPEGVPNRTAGTAFFQACSRVVPVWFDGDVADSSVRSQLAIGEFTNVVLSATETDVSHFESAFQRLVLADEGTSIEQLQEPEQLDKLVAFV